MPTISKTGHGIKVLNITSEEIKNASDDVLFKLLNKDNFSGIIPEPTLHAIQYELSTRQLLAATKPHWTVTPTFIVSCIAAIASIISIAVSIYFSVYYNANDNKHAKQSNTIESNARPQ